MAEQRDQPHLEVAALSYHPGMAEQRDQPHLEVAALSDRSLLLDVWKDVKKMAPQVEVLMSQDLNNRVRALEQKEAARTGGAQKAGTIDSTIRGWLAVGIALAGAVISSSIALIALLTRGTPVT